MQGQGVVIDSRRLFVDFGALFTTMGSESMRVFREKTLKNKPMKKIFAVTGATAFAYRREFGALLKSAFNGRFASASLHDVLTSDLSTDTVVLVTESDLSALERFGDRVTPIHIDDAGSYQRGFADIAATLFQLDGGTIIGFDGTASSGKGTLSRMAAKYMDGMAVDTGLFYRYLAHEAGTKKILPSSPELGKYLADIVSGYRPFEDDGFLRTPQVDESVAIWGGVPIARKAVFSLQMVAAYSSGCKVICPEGRDITTEPFRKGRFKMFVDAPIELRAQWRAGQNGRSVEWNLEALKKRDHDDMNRKVSPLYWDEKNGVTRIWNDKDPDQAFQSVKDVIVPQASRA